VAITRSKRSAWRCETQPRPGSAFCSSAFKRINLHLLIEADEPTAFERGVRGLMIRVAKALNRILGRRGRVWGDRYHARLLRTPREVRNALIYVLANWKKHEPGAHGFDPRSSAAWFDGWKATPPLAATRPVARARTWLASVGWRRRGLIDVDESPSSRAGRSARTFHDAATTPMTSAAAASPQGGTRTGPANEGA